MKNLFILCFLFTIQLFYAQKDNTLLKKMTYEDLKKAFFENDGKISTQKRYADEFINRAKKENNQSKLARGYYYYSLLSDGEEKIIYFDSIIKNTKTPKTDSNFPLVAYYEKADFLETQFRFDEAINCYVEAEEIALERNIDYYYHFKLAIGILKSEKMGEVKEALPLFKEYNSFFHKKKENKDYAFDYENSLFALADAYKSLKMLDSSSYYNKLGYIHSKKFKNEYLNGIFILNEGANNILKGKFIVALDSLNKALPTIIKNKDKNNELAAYYYYGKAYEGLKKEKKALNYFKKVDSMYLIKGTITPEFTSGYSYIINYYKKIKDKDNQILYIDKFIKIDSLLQKNYKQITKKIQKDYDIPHLMKEKEVIIQDLKGTRKINYYIIFLLFSILLLSLFLVFKQTNQKKIYKQRFEALVKNNETATIEKKQVNSEKNEDIGIAEETIQDILIHLEQFEKKNQYLNASVSIQSLAQAFTTNSKYLSIIINSKKEKSFVNYINDLRIDYIVKELKNKKNIRKYTMVAISEEAGFNTAESFSKAFFKRTGIKPSYFVKKLEEI